MAPTETEVPPTETGTAIPETQSHSHAEGEAHTHAPALNPECRREVEVEIPAEEVEKETAATLKKFRKQAKIPGFRPGKVPESVIRNRFGNDLRKEVLDTLLPRYFRAAVEPQGLVPVSQPSVIDLQFHDGQPLKFKAEFEVLPPVDIAGYQDVRVERPDAALTEDEFQHELVHIRDAQAIMEPLPDDHVLADGDFAQVAFKGYFPQPEGEATPEGDRAPDVHGENALIEIGGADTVAAFTEALRGAKTGQTMSLDVQYPEDFRERRLAGRTVSYEIEVNGAKKKVLPELDLDMVKKFGEFESMDDFYTKLRADMEQGKQRRAYAEARDKLVEALAAKYAFPVPEALIEQQTETRLERGLRALAQQGMNAQQMRQLDFARLRAAQRDSAITEMRSMILLDRIADAENVQVEEEELDRELLMAAMQEQEPPEQLRRRLTEDGTLARIREQIRRDKTAQLLVERQAA